MVQTATEGGKTCNHETCHHRCKYWRERQTQCPNLSGYPNRSSNMNWGQQKIAIMGAAGPPKALAAHDISLLTIIWQEKLKSTSMLHPPSPIAIINNIKSEKSSMTTARITRCVHVSILNEFFRRIYKDWMMPVSHVSQLLVLPSWQEWVSNSHTYLCKPWKVTPEVFILWIFSRLSSYTNPKSVHIRYTIGKAGLVFCVLVLSYAL